MPEDSIHSELERWAAEVHGVRPEQLEKLGAFESDVYAVEHPDGARVIKVIAPEHRSAELVQAEVDWLNSLLESGAGVSRPVRNAAGEWLAVEPGGGHVTVAFERAPGSTVRMKGMPVEVVEEWGRLLGRLQAHARTYRPPGPRRPTLLQQSYGEKLDQIEGDDRFMQAATELVDAARRLLVPDGGLESGLVHADLHNGNFLVDGGNLTAIDFDDCAYGSFLFDLAIPLYYATRGLEHDPVAVEERFLSPFLRGFLSVAPLPDGGADAVDLVLRFRQVELVIALDLKFLPAQRDANLLEVERDLKQRVAAGEEFLPPTLLRKYFG